MKTKSKCVGCHAIKLVNDLGLCKRCNTHSHDFISSKEMERFRQEREIRAVSKEALKAKKAAEDAEKESAEEGAEEKEGEEAAEGGEKAEEGSADAGN